MSSLTNFSLSKYRLRILKILDDLKKPATKCLYLDPLIKGVPGEVFRKCGKQNCQCASDPAKRHGPYKVITVYKNGKQKQIPLKKDEAELWPLVTMYQFQMDQLKEVRSMCAELDALILEIITARIKEFPVE
jgi:hypothetical protein